MSIGSLDTLLDRTTGTLGWQDRIRTVRDLTAVRGRRPCPAAVALAAGGPA